ncbi:MAG: LamG domain-containing protein [Phycisphaerae bacterium]|nr:LamG domain-containing protein [Phycisphaerae bacterium]
MAAENWLFKLVCGSAEVDLHQGSEVEVRDRSVQAPARQNEMQIGLSLMAGGANRQTVLRRIKRDILSMLERARAYYEEDIGDPVELWVRPDDGVNLEPTYGLGSFRRRVYGGWLEEPQLAGKQFGGSKVPDYVLHLRVREYWHGATQYVLAAKGGVKDNKDGTLGIWEGTSNLLSSPTRPSGWTTGASAYMQGWTSENALQYNLYYPNANDFDISHALDDGTVFGPFVTWTTKVGGAPTEFYCTGVASPTAGTTYTFQAQALGIEMAHGLSACIAVAEIGGATASAISSASMILSDSWTSASMTYTVAAANRDVLRVYLRAASLCDNTIVLWQKPQLEAKAYATPYCDGYLGNGHRWSGTAGSSSSTRDPAVLWGCAQQGVTGVAGTISLWVKDMEWADDRAHFLVDFGSINETTLQWPRLSLYKSASNTLVWRAYDPVGASYAVSTATADYTKSDYYHICGVWSPSILRLHVNSMQVGASVANIGNTTPALKHFHLGSNLLVDGSASPANCNIHSDLRIYDEALTDSQISALYSNGRGPGYLPYLASAESYAPATGWVPMAQISNHEDATAGHQNHTQLGNIPGDLEAALSMHLWVSPAAAYIAWGQQRSEGDRFIPNYPAYKGIYIGTGASIAASAADADCSYGAKLTLTNGVAATWENAFTVSLYNCSGRYRVFARVYDTSSATGVISLRGRAVNDATKSEETKTVFGWANEDGVSAPALNTWCWVDLGEVELPPLGHRTMRAHSEIECWAKRDSGVGTLSVDFIAVFPTEHGGQLGLQDGSFTSGFLYATLQGIHQHRSAQVNDGIPNYIRTSEPIQQYIGDYPTALPGHTSQIVFATTTQASTYRHQLDASLAVAMEIEPRFVTPW